MPVKQAMINTMQKPKHDVLYTPAEGVYPLAKMFRKLSLQSKLPRVWECTDPGGSRITDILTNDGFSVISTDITTGFDFLKDDPDFEFNMIVTNPPYSIKDDFITKCYEYGKPFALLMPINALEGIRRNKLYRKYGMSVLVLDKRLDFSGQGKTWFNTSWFIGNLFDHNQIIFAEL